MLDIHILCSHLNCAYRFQMFTTSTGTRVESRFLRCHGHQDFVVANALIMRRLLLSKKISGKFLQVSRSPISRWSRDWENKNWIVLEYVLRRRSLSEYTSISHISATHWLPTNCALAVEMARLPGTSVVCMFVMTGACDRKCILGTISGEDSKESSFEKDQRYGQCTLSSARVVTRAEDLMAKLQGQCCTIVQLYNLVIERSFAVYNLPKINLNTKLSYH